MPRFHLVTHPEEPSGPELAAPLAGELLRQAGVHWGRVAAPAQGASSEPRLRHARALLELQQRYGPMDHVRRRRATSAAQAALLAAPERADVEEWLLVVEGRLDGQWPVPGGWLRGSWEALEWFTRPPGLRATPLPVGPVRAPEPAECLVLSRERRQGLGGLAGLVRATPQPAARREPLPRPTPPVPQQRVAAPA